MKLKEAKMIARIGGFNYVAVDKGGAVFAYAGKPVRCMYQWCTINDCPFKCIGRYTGKKDWEDTLRKVS